MKLTDIVAPDCVQLNIEATDKTDALTKLVNALTKANKVNNHEEVLRVILEREKLMSTGIGHGVALPHGKTNAVNHSMAIIATLQTPIDFDALDDKPVQIILLLVGTEENVGGHLRLLSRISRMVGSEAFRSSLIEARTTEEALNVFSAYEEERE